MAPPVVAVLCVLLVSCAAPPFGLPEDVAAAGSDARGNPPPEPASSSPRDAEPARPLPVLADGTLGLSIEEAVLRSLESNRALSVERLNVPIQRTFEDEERAVFDPVLSAEAGAGAEKIENANGGNTRVRSVGAGIGVSKLLPTGTELEAGLTSERMRTTPGASRYVTRAGLTVTQALLRGRGLGPNLATLRQAQLDTRFSEYELRGFAEALVAEVETTYWDYAQARSEVGIFEESLKLAEQQLRETEQRIRVGDLAETEKAAGQAELALRNEALINARSRVATLRVRLLRLMGPAALAGAERDMTPQTAPAAPAEHLGDLADHVAVALRMRPQLNQAQLLIQRGDLEIVKTKNGLLPRMDLFISLGKSGYANSFGRSVEEIDSDGYDVSAGLSFELPLGNRPARALHRRAVLTRRQRQHSLRSVEDLVREDVQAAYIEVGRAREQVDATKATRRFQQEKVRAETAKFHVGKSTALLVAQAQRDLVESQVAEIESVINHLKALTDLFRLEGSLLERRGIEMPGREPVGPARH